MDDSRISRSSALLRSLSNSLRTGNKLKIVAYALTALIGALLIAHTFGEHYESRQVRLRGAPRRVARQTSSGGNQQLKDPFPNRPRIQTRNGHLLIEASQDKNIDFKTSGSRGSITINGHKLDQLLDVTKALESSAVRLNRKSSGDEDDSPNPKNQYELVMRNLFASEDRFKALEKSIADLQNQVNELKKQTTKIAKRVRGVSKIGKQQETILSKLKRNDCINSDTGQPVCKNGATCIDTYDGFKCLCPNNYEGLTCEQDVDECAKFKGTDLGCQNGARCTNLPGSYQCECTAQYHGVHCTEQHDDCSLSSSRSLCGYGKCINLARNVANQARFECICDQGWTTNGLNPACVVDINECLAGLPGQTLNASSDGSLPWANALMAAYPCSQNPYVDCINLPGSFQCGPCPTGYTGNGRVCRDVDECATNNGGCSQAPLVECINTPGSRRCGLCPPGFTGDGLTCTPVSACSAEPNGGCHPMARCKDLAELAPDSRLCFCRFPYTGDGVGVNGCRLPDDIQLTNSTFAEPTTDDCRPNPCLNGAQCETTDASFECICPLGWTGRLCNQPVSACGGRFYVSRGSLRFPLGGSFNELVKQSSNNGNMAANSATSGANGGSDEQADAKPQSGERHYNCLWFISVASNMSVRLQFADLINKMNSGKRVQLYLANQTSGSHLVAPPTCSEYLDVSERLDGSQPDEAGRLLARFCADARKPSMGLNDGKVIVLLAKTNSVALRYSFSATRTQFGEPSLSFSLNWTKTEPPCGADLAPLESGSIASPRFPDFYQAGVECRYLIRVPPGKRIRLQFGELNLLTSWAASSGECVDSLTILDGSIGSDRPVLFKHCANNATLMSSKTLPAPIISSSSAVELLLDSRINSATPLMRPRQQNGFYLTYSAETSTPGCGGLYTLKASTIVSSDYQAKGGAEDPLTTAQLVRYFEQRTSYQYPHPLPAPGRNGFNSSSSWTGQMSGAQRCEYEIRPANQARNHKVSLDWLEMPTLSSDSDSLMSRWGRNMRCLHRRLTVLEGDPLDSSNRTELATFCAGDHYNASLPQFPPILSSGHLLLLVYESRSVRSEPPMSSIGKPSGFRLHYSTVCTAVYQKLMGSIQVDVSSEVSECIYHIILPPNNTIALQVSQPIMDQVSAESASTGLTMPDGTCAARAVFLDGAIQQAVPQALLGVNRQLSSYNFRTAINSDVSESDSGSSSIDSQPPETSPDSGKQPQRVGDSDADPSSRSSSDTSASSSSSSSPTSSFFWQYSGSQVHDIKEFKVCRISRLSFNSLWNHLSIMIRLRDFTQAAQVSTDDGSDSRTQLRFLIHYQAIHTCGGIVSQPREGVLPLGERNLPANGRQSSDGVAQSVSTCTWILRAPVGQQVELTFEFPIAEIQRRYSDWLVWSRKQQKQPERSKQQAETDVSTSSAEFNCSQIFQEMVELYEPSPNRTRHLCPSDLLANDNSNSTFIWTTLSNIVYIRVQNETTNAKNLTNTTWPNRKPLQSRDLKVRYRYLSTRERHCGGRLIMDSGVIRSPRFPFNYPPLSNCVWIIQAKDRQQVRLNFTRFELEQQAGCLFDYLEIRNGASSRSPLIGRFCNQDLQSKVLISHSNQVWLRFQSDASLGRAGFELHYDGAQTGCGGRLSSPSGQIDSPNYPSPYAHSADCEWLIESSESNRIELTVEDLDLNNGDSSSCQVDGAYADYLEIFDSNKVNVRQKSLGRFCHLSQLKWRQFNSTSNKLLVVYRSQALDNSRGFRLTYRTRCKPVELFGYRGVIESPGYPSNYLPRSSCGWFIRSPLGSNLTFAVADLELEGSGDSLPVDLQREASNRAGKIVSTASSGRQRTCREDFVQIWALYPQVTNGSQAQQVRLQQSALSQFRNLTWSAQQDKRSNGSASGPVRRLARNLCGLLSDLPDDERLIELDTNLAYLRFETDHSVEGRGFRFEWHSHSCGGYGENRINYRGVKEPSIAFVEGAPTGRPTECIWLLEQSSSVNALEISVSSDMRSSSSFLPGADACDGASLTIYDGPTDDAPVLLRNCDSQNANREILMTSSGQALVRFYTSGSHSYARTFSLAARSPERNEYTCISNQYDLHPPFNRQAGMKRSPNYPDLYEAKEHRCHAMMSVSGGRLLFRIEELDIPVEAVASPATGLLDQARCRSSGNYLVIRSLSHAVEETFCGRMDESQASNLARRQVVLEQEASWIEFHTQGGLRGRWQLSYKRLCGSLVYIDGPARDLKSPNYPDKPDWPQAAEADNPNNSENVCIWRLKSGSNHPNGDRKLLHLSVMNFVASERKSDYDCLRIYEGLNITLRQSNFNLSDLDARLQPKVKLCKQTDIKHSTLQYISQGEEVTVLITGATIARVRVKTFENYCGGELHLNQAEFASLAYPQPYANNLDCHYLIKGSPGSRITLNFLAFDLPEGNADSAALDRPGATGCDNVDYVEIRQISLQKQLKRRIKYLSSNKWSDFGRMSLNEIKLTSPTNDSVAANNSLPVPRKTIERLFELTKLYFLFHEIVDEGGRANRLAMPLDELYENSQLLGRFCGNRKPNLSNLTLRDQVLIRFRSHSGQQESGKPAPRGFLAEYKIELGGLIKLDEDEFKSEGVISSPNYPTKVRLNKSITWTFEAKLNQVIQFDLVALEVGSVHQDCTGDSLNLFDGFSSRSDIRLARLCGYLGFTVPSWPYLHTHKGLEYYVHKPLPIYQAHDSQVRANLIRSVRTSSNVAAIVYENHLADGAFLLRYRALDKAAAVSSYTNESLTVAVDANAPVELDEVMQQKDRELIAEPLKLNATKTCSQIFRLSVDNANQVNVTSPGWPEQPPADLDCYWLVYTRENRNIRLSVEPADLANFYNSNIDSEKYPYSPRPYDYCLDPRANASLRSFIAVYDGATHLAPLIARHCLPVAPVQFQSTGRHLLVRYVHSGNVAQAAFRARASLDACGGQYHLGSYFADIRDRKDKSKQYANNLSCRYYVFAPDPTHVLSLNFNKEDFDLAGDPADTNCTTSGDYLEIRDLPLEGDSMEAAHQAGRLLARYCAGRKPDMVLYTPGAAISIEFHTDKEKTARGWRVYVNNMDAERACGNNHISLTADQPYGLLRSPNWPHGFHGRRHCRYILSSDMNRTLEVRFLRLVRQVTNDSSRCTDTLDYLDDNEVFFMRYLNYDSEHLLELKSPLSGALLRKAVKSMPCDFATERSSSSLSNKFEDLPSNQIFKTLSSDEYLSLSSQYSFPTRRISTKSHMLVLEYDTNQALPGEGFVALVGLKEKICGGQISYPSANLLESSNFAEVTEDSGDYIYCDWSIDTPLESNPNVIISSNLQSMSQVGTFESSFMVFQVLEIPASIENTTYYDESWAADRLERSNEACGLSRLLVSGSYLTFPIFACGNLTGIQRWLWVEPFMRMVSLRTKNLRAKGSGSIYRGLRAYYYEKSCLQMERVLGDAVRLRSHPTFPNSSYTPAICKWELRLRGGDYELYFEAINFRPPLSSSGSPVKTPASADCDPRREPDLDYLEVRASGERDSPLLARYCFNNQAQMRAQNASVLNMRSELSFTFVAGLNRLSAGAEQFESAVAPNAIVDQTKVFGWSLKVVRVRNDTMSEFCREYTAHSIYRFIKSNDDQFYTSSIYTSYPTLANFLYPNNTHCEITLNLEEGARFNFTFIGVFDFEQSRDCKNDYIQLDDLLPADGMSNITLATPIERTVGLLKPPRRAKMMITKAANTTATAVATTSSQVLNPRRKEPIARRIGRWCGRTRPTGYFLSSGRSVRLTFHSDARIEGKGFQLEYNIISANSSSSSNRSIDGLLLQ